MDGITILKELRKNSISIPVILLTAKGDLTDKVIGLDCGADDYLPKPFQTEELLARLRVLSRRHIELQNGGLMQTGDIVLDPNALILFCTGYVLHDYKKENMYVHKNTQ